jgi:radical SAM protein (TIGR04043 family)
VELSLRAELAVRGLRAAPPVRRRAGAGPSDDGHWQLTGECAATLPLAPRSPFALDAHGRLTRDGVVVEDVMVEAVERPRFYDLTTDDGVRYDQLARLHGRDVLATTVVQTCIRYTSADTRCRFCTIEESLRAGATTQVKRPEELAEVAAAAVKLDGVRQMVMTTGTSGGADRGAKHLSKCVRAVKDAVPGLPIQVQIEPPVELAWIDKLRDAGADAIGIHIEALDQDVRERWTPGKATVSVRRYEEAWARALAAFGPNRVSTYLLVGLGEDPDELVDGAKRLIALGIYPFVVPLRPLGGSLAHADGVEAPPPEVLAEVTRRVGGALARAGMRGRDQVAGCAACGACSALQHAGG